MGMNPSGRSNGIRRSANKYDLELRRYEVLKMRVAGVTWREIVATLEINQSVAYDDLRWCLAQKEAGNTEHYRQIEDERLNEAIRAAFEVLDANRKTELALKAVDRIDRLVGRRAALLGLNAPVELNVHATEKTQADLELEELLREAQARNALTHQQILEQVTGDPGPAAG